MLKSQQRFKNICGGNTKLAKEKEDQKQFKQI